MLGKQLPGVPSRSGARWAAREGLPATREALPGDKNRAKCSGSAHPGIGFASTDAGNASPRAGSLSPRLGTMSTGIGWPSAGPGTPCRRLAVAARPADLLNPALHSPAMNPPLLRCLLLLACLCLFTPQASAYYEPASGRFLSPDPLGHEASMSLYDYANGDPVNRFDPTGRQSFMMGSPWDNRFNMSNPEYAAGFYKGMGAGAVMGGILTVGVVGGILTGGAADLALASFLPAGSWATTFGAGVAGGLGASASSQGAEMAFGIRQNFSVPEMAAGGLFFGGFNVAGRAVGEYAVPALGRFFGGEPKTPTLTFDSGLEKGTGYIDKFGNMTVSSEGTALDRLQARLHEQFHSWFSPRDNGGWLNNFRADVRDASVQLSQALRYGEEAGAQTYAEIASLRLSGKSFSEAVSDGLRYPFMTVRGALSPSVVASETAIGVGAVGGMFAGSYYASEYFFNGGNSGPLGRKP